MSGIQPATSNISDKWETVKGKKRSRHNSPEEISHPEEITQEQRPAPAPQARPHTIQVVKTEAWKSEFDILMSLNKERPELDFEVRHTRDGATLLKTTSLEMRDSILLIEELQKKPVKFTLMAPPTRNLRYVITNVPSQIPDFYFQETFGFTDVKRISKGEEKTRAVLFTSTQTPPTEIRVPFYRPMPIRRYVPEPAQCFKCHRWNHTIKVCRSRPRCYYCGKQGPKDAPAHYVCCKKPEQPKCINCQGSHNPAYKGCPSRINMIYTIHERMGLEPLRKTTNPEVQTATKTTPAPWKGVTYHIQTPGTIPQHQTQGPWKIPQQPQPAWKVTQHAQKPACLQQSAFPPLPQPDKRIIVQESKKLQPATTEKSVTTTVTAILAHMNHLMKTVDTIKELIKALPRELYKKAQEDLTAAEKRIPQDQMLSSVLDSAITSSGMTPKAQPKKKKVQKSCRQPKEVATKNPTQIPSKPPTQAPAQGTSQSSPGTSEASEQTEISC
jgi:hypothetical protein